MCAAETMSVDNNRNHLETCMPHMPLEQSHISAVVTGLPEVGKLG